MNAREVLRRYLRQRLEAGEREVFLDGLSAAEVLALLNPPPAPRASSQAAKDLDSVAAGAGIGHQRAAAVAGEAGGAGRLLQALAEHAPGVIGEARGRGVVAGVSGGNISGVATGAPEDGGAPNMLPVLAEEAASCTGCRLHEGRQHVVFGEGNPRARVVVVGEAPGREEDRTGRPFVGPAGKLLDLLLLTAGFPREEVYICNVIKCRPPENRDPMRDEVEACSTYLRRQLDAIQPTVLLALGKFAAQTLIGSEQSISALRGGVHSFSGIPLVVTFHPAFLLRSPQWTRAAWGDLQLLREVLESRRHGDGD